MPKKVLTLFVYIIGDIFWVFTIFAILVTLATPAFSKITFLAVVANFLIDMKMCSSLYHFILYVHNLCYKLLGSLVRTVVKCGYVLQTLRPYTIFSATILLCVRQADFSQRN